MALLLMEVLYKHHHSTLTINVALVKSGPSPLLATKTGPLGPLLAVRSVQKVPLPRGPILVVKSGPWGASCQKWPENIMSLLPSVLLRV